MKLVRKKWPVRKSLFFILCCGYILLALLSYIPGHKIFQHLFLSEQTIPDTHIRFLLVVPVFCLIVAGFFFFYTLTRIFSELRPSHVKFRFFISFAAVIMLAALPFMLFIPSSVSSLLNAWNNTDITAAADTGSAIAGEYYRNRQNTVKTAVDSYLTMINMGRDTKSLTWIWPKIRELDPDAASLQIFTMENTAASTKFDVYSENGDSSCFMPAAEALTVPDGMFPETLKDFSAMQNNCITYIKTLRTGKTARKCIYTSRLYPQFTGDMEILQNAKTHTDRITGKGARIISDFYLIAFCLLMPSLLLLLPVIFILSGRLASPVETLAESVKRQNSGSQSLHILPDDKCREEKLIGTFVNNAEIRRKRR